jgi:hypothetical protein
LKAIPTCLSFWIRICYNGREAMVRYKICFYCNREYTGLSRKSRKDNAATICALCAEFEAVSEFLSQKIQKPTEPVLETLYRLLALRFAPVS